MKDFPKPSAEDVLNEMDIPNYLPDGADKHHIMAATKAALKSMEEHPLDYRLHIETVHEFMKALWRKYDCEDVFQILDQLTRIEPALLDLERYPGAGRRYRDHYVHLFHVFVFGLRIMSGMARQVQDDTQLSHILKVRDEKLGGKITGRNEESGAEVSFRDYGWKERMFYLWTIMSTLHDISIPITHLDNIRDALNKFSEKFHLEISGPTLIPRFPPGLDTYLEAVSSLFDGKLEPATPNDSFYRRGEGGAYVKGYLERLVSVNHGVLGGFLVYKIIEEIFLHGRSQKYRLYPTSFKEYEELVLKQDIARATLAICLHDLRYDSEYSFPGFMPLKFDDYPLTFILILTDSLQEYLRWEGMSIRGGTKLSGFPALSICLDGNRFIAECLFSIDPDPTNKELFRKEVTRVMKDRGRSLRSTKIRAAAAGFCELIGDELESKVYLGDRAGDSYTLKLSLYEGDSHLFTQTFCTEVNQTCIATD